MYISLSFLFSDMSCPFYCEHGLATFICTSIFSGHINFKSFEVGLFLFAVVYTRFSVFFYLLLNLCCPYLRFQNRRSEIKQRAYAALSVPGRSRRNRQPVGESPVKNTDDRRFSTDDDLPTTSGDVVGFGSPASGSERRAMSLGAEKSPAPRQGEPDDSDVAATGGVEVPARRGRPARPKGSKVFLSSLGSCCLCEDICEYLRILVLL